MFEILMFVSGLFIGYGARVFYNLWCGKDIPLYNKPYVTYSNGVTKWYRPHNVSMNRDTKICANCNTPYNQPVGKDVCPNCGY